MKVVPRDPEQSTTAQEKAESLRTSTKPDITRLDKKLSLGSDTIDLHALHEQVKEGNKNTPQEGRPQVGTPTTSPGEDERKEGV